ncbi:MAG: sulfite exporter TauE/SafE family protein [Massiliimalia sp.]
MHLSKTEIFYPISTTNSINKEKNHKSYLLGIVAGTLNGLFGSGGGIALVPMLEHLKLPPQKAHATSVAMILPLSIASALGYWSQNVPIHWDFLLSLLPWGILGSACGAFLLQKIPNHLLRRVFGALLIYSGVRMLL